MKNRILECYVTTLRRSGYNDNEIKKFATDGIVDYVRRVKREEEGGDPIHRDKVDIKKSTYSKKLTIKLEPLGITSSYTACLAKLKYIKSKIIEDKHTNTTDQEKETHTNIINDQNSNTNQGGHKAQTQIL